MSSLRAIVCDEKKPLQKVSNLIKYDPGLYFSLLHEINMPDKKTETASISQAITLIGAQGVENYILQQDYFLGPDYLLLWCYAVLAGETAAHINQWASIAEDEEAFFAGVMPSVGMLLMLVKNPSYKKILDILLKISIDDRIFTEERLFGTNHIAQLNKRLSAPKIYRDTVNLINTIFTRDGNRRSYFEHPARLSVAYQSFQLLQLVDVSESAAQCLLFPANVEAQENFRELCKRHFKIAENETEELLTSVVERFESVCKEFNVENISEKFISEAGTFHAPEALFITTSKALQSDLEAVYEANREDKNILLQGEASAGKRLLSIALHHHGKNPRRTKPFIAVHCGTMDSETLEAELLGAKGGFRGLERHKGAFELANGGTVLLKDIEKIPLPLQEQLAGIFSREEFYKIGETHPVPLDVKFIITSRKNVFEEAQEGRFSERLLDALKPVSIYIPPLRERRDDIELIADNIITKYNLNLSDKALRMGLHEYYETQPFPNNLKDLKRLLFFLSAKHSLVS